VPTHRDEALLTLELPDRPAAPSAARKALTALNGSLHLISESRLLDAQLVLTEVVANAVRHGGRSGAPIGLTVRATPEVMRVEVTDDGDGFDEEPAAERPDERGGGWGLPIVAALAHRWGVDREEATTVWFEIDRPQREEPVTVDPSPPQL
jgi:anti-sigma regulatory factor (Ser/Thr protein kinase)